MRLVKLRSLQGHVFEEELASCKHFERIWTLIMLRYDMNPLDDTPFNVAIETAGLDLLLSWGRMHTRDPVCTNTSVSRTLHHLDMEERVFLLGRTTDAFVNLGVLAQEVSCPRLYSEVNLLNMERTRHCRIHKTDVWPEQLIAIRTRAEWTRAEHRQRRRVCGVREQVEV